MASISSLGSASGLDLNTLLSNLMTAEQAPLTKLQQKEASYQTKLSSLGSLKGALSSFQSAAQAMKIGSGQTAASKFSTYNATVQDSTVATATAKTGAAAGIYSFEASSLAQVQRLASPVPNTALTTSLAAGGDLLIELGTLSSASGSKTYSPDSARNVSIHIDAGSTLEQVRDAINTAATDGRISATIVTGTNSSTGALEKHLMLTGGSTGSSNVMRLTGLSGLDYNPVDDSASTLSQSASAGGQAATDAAYKINGIAGTSSTNTISDRLDGVTITLLKTNSGSPTNLTVTRSNTSSLTSALTNFVKAYNDAATAMKKLGFYDSATQTAGPLQGDSTLTSAQNQLRNLLLTQAGGSSAYQTLTSIGVEVQKDGTLKLDSTKLSDAINADFSGVAGFISKIGVAFDSGIDSLVGTSGVVTAATDGTNRIISDLKKRETNVQNRLVQIEARYRAQFTSLDKLVGQMKQTGNYLTQQLASLSSLNSTSK